MVFQNLSYLTSIIFPHSIHSPQDFTIFLFFTTKQNLQYNFKSNKEPSKPFGVSGLEFLILLPLSLK